ncbi:O-linked N-acetylglucosamine transferase family protein [Variovorax sp. PBL-E5]|uniref:O-linked N-acetylglucosamine transferase family protein n=1 Tax=Variovorax sp. PBL-E5 TaxID=434014 RepID=UPI0013171D27|nr:tetratricopeptide repeat protein [Variovorax sp. PBL-E5]VTU24845.1 putative PEP-CTERM system TPR-repeat lipoprotein [Variovorax sp. PBL-E5]
MFIKKFIGRLRPEPRGMQEQWVQADLALAEGNASEAVAIYRRLASVTPRSASDHLYVALSQVRVDELKQGMEILEEGLGKFPEDRLLLEAYVRLCADMRQMDRAVLWFSRKAANRTAACESLFVEFPEPNVQISLVEYCFAHGMAETADARLDSVLDHCHDTTSAWRLADLLLLHKRSDRANSIYQRLTARPPENARALLHSALAEYRLQHPVRAAEVLEHGLADYPDAADLREHFVSICSELRQVDRIIRVLLPDQGSEAQALELLLDTYKAPQVQVNLIGCCLRAGLPELAERGIRSALLDTDNIEQLWILSDLLFNQGRTKDTEGIYRQLIARAPDSAQSALYSGLAAYRIKQPKQAADLLEAGLRKFPDSEQLLEHFTRICVEIHAVDRVSRFVAPAARSKSEVCELLFEQFIDSPTYINLIEYCAEHGLAELAERKLAQVQQTSTDPAALWAAADLLAKMSRRNEAADIYKRLSARSLENAEDYYYSSLALLRLDKTSECADLLERGQQRYAADTNLSALYMQVCASRVEYDRYVNSNLVAGVVATLSIVDFYEEFSRRAPVEFVLICTELESRLDAAVVDTLKKRFISFLHENPQSTVMARSLVFLSRYLDLRPEFTAGILNAIIESHRVDGDAFRADERSLRIMYDLSPAMVPRQAHGHEERLRQFIAASRALAGSPVELVDPLLEMSGGWTPWQLIFCQAEPKFYGEAMAAFETLAFRTWPRLNHVAQHVGRNLLPSAKGLKKIRVGINVHDSMPMISGLLPRLNADLFETVFLRPGKQGQTLAAKNWLERAGKTVEFSDLDTYAAIQTIEGEELDIIIAGPSMGASFYPMMAKLAPLHMILLEPNWTDGLTNSDYYISWRRAEPEDPAAYYKTAVSLFEHPPYWIERPDMDDKGGISPEARAEVRKRLLDASPEVRVYLCANTPPKIHPEMDELFLKILQRDKEAILVLLRGDFPPARTLRSRLRERLGVCYDRVVFMPTLTKNDAHLLLQSVDCCLDSYPLCGMSSSFDGAMLGVPLVTLPADIPFSRWTAAIYEYIGVSGLTARDKQDYVELALRLASDAAWRSEKAAELRQKSVRYVESLDSSKEFENFLLAAWDRKVKGLPPTNWIEGQWH